MKKKASWRGNCLKLFGNNVQKYPCFRLPDITHLFYLQFEDKKFDNLRSGFPGCGEGGGGGGRMGG